MVAYACNPIAVKQGPGAHWKPLYPNWNSRPMKDLSQIKWWVPPEAELWPSHYVNLHIKIYIQKNFNSCFLSNAVNVQSCPKEKDKNKKRNSGNSCFSWVNKRGYDASWASAYRINHLTDCYENPNFQEGSPTKRIRRYGNGYASVTVCVYVRKSTRGSWGSNSSYQAWPQPLYVWVIRWPHRALMQTHLASESELPWDQEAWNPQVGEWKIPGLTRQLEELKWHVPGPMKDRLQKLR